MTIQTPSQKPVELAPSLALEAITQRIFVLRDQKVLLDADLAALYGVETRRLNEQVRRNRDRFPSDFIFELTQGEFDHLKSQIATSSLIAPGHGGRRKLPLAFTEHGAIMAATVLSSARAVEVSVFVVRAFLKMRELVASHQGLSERLDALEAKLEDKTESLAMQHDTFSRNTKAQLRSVFATLRELMTPPAQPDMPVPPKRSIGFITPEDQPQPKARKGVAPVKPERNK
jgi:ORF6N domain